MLNPDLRWRAALLVVILASTPFFAMISRRRKWQELNLTTLFVPSMAVRSWRESAHVLAGHGGNTRCAIRDAETAAEPLLKTAASGAANCKQESGYSLV